MRLIRSGSTTPRASCTSTCANWIRSSPLTLPSGGWAPRVVGRLHLTLARPDQLRRLPLALGSLALLLAACASVSPEAPPGIPGAVTAKPSERSAPPTPRSPFKEPPGVVLADVTQANVDKTICVPGWTATVRPATSFTQGLKRVMLVRAGLPPGDSIKYELDHFVPLAVGGHPRSEDNLWLQKWDGAWNARIKDRLERKLQVMVCAGE